MAIHVPSLNQIYDGSVLTKELGRDIVQEFRKTGKLKINGKYIIVITDIKQPEIRKLLRLLSCWPDSSNLKKIEEKYHISDILIITWNYKKDIDKWKLKHLPNIFQDYSPPKPKEY